MSDEIIRQYSPEQTAKMRDDLLRKRFAPFVGQVFAQHPALNSAVLSVAQYWCDEAWDAVHGELSYSLQRDPDIDAFYARVRAEGDQEDMDELSYHRTLFIEGLETARAIGFPLKAAPVRPPGFLDRLFKRTPAYDSALGKQQSDTVRKLAYDVFWGSDGWDDNGEAIPLFAAFCHEEGSQEENFAHNYRPFVIFRRAAQPGAPADFEIIGEMVRPWLDGVGPREFDEAFPDG